MSFMGIYGKDVSINAGTMRVERTEQIQLVWVAKNNGKPESIEHRSEGREVICVLVI